MARRTIAFSTAESNPQLLMNNPANMLEAGRRVTGRTVIVGFKYQIRKADGTLAWKTGRSVMDFPKYGYFRSEQVANRGTYYLAFAGNLIAKDMMRHPEQYSQSISGDPVNLVLYDTLAEQLRTIKITSLDFVLRRDDLMTAMGLRNADGTFRAVAHANEFQKYMAQRLLYGHDHTRSFTYMIPGCSMENLQSLLPDAQYVHPECNQMCVYDMLANANIDQRNGRPPAVFQPENVNRWMNTHVRPVGGLRDGLSTEDIQRHAQAHNYTHLGMDLGRSVIMMHLRDPKAKNGHNFKAIYYVNTGNHVQPIVDPQVIRALATSTVRQNCQRGIAGYSNSGGTKKTTEVPHQNHPKMKRTRSLDRIIRPEFGGTEELDRKRATESLDTCLPYTEGLDWAAEEALINEDNLFGEEEDTPMDTQQLPRKRVQLPLASQTERFHFFESTDETLIRQRCRPDYREGTDPSLIHYYVCTDQDDVEFLYNYLVRVLDVEPDRSAKTFNGCCRQLKIHNTRWVANPNIHTILRLHILLHPTEPFRMCGLAGYAFNMFQRHLYTLRDRRMGNWECMSQYPPNLQKLMDTTHPYNKPKIILTNFDAKPYSRPDRLSLSRPPAATDSSTEGAVVSAVQTLIPLSCRRRIDLIRSYTAILHQNQEEYPIHDLTNQLIPFVSPTHDAIPIGTYLVQIPSAEEIQRDPTMRRGYRILTCLKPGESRMMGHKMVRAMLHRNLLKRDQHIQKVCATDPQRQRACGPQLMQALQRMVQQVYTDPQLSEFCPKHLINHLVGVFNGTQVAHSGNRMLFKEVDTLYCVLSAKLGDDQWKNMRILHREGTDSMWHKPYSYFEVDFSGSAYRHFHFQPVYNQVLEDQCITVYDICLPIPLDRLIQIKADAIEYQIDHCSIQQQSKWAHDLDDQTVSRDEYNQLTSQQIYDRGYLGLRFKEEAPKEAESAGMYYWDFNTHTNLQWNRLPESADHPTDARLPEVDYFEQWQGRMRVRTPSDELGSDDCILQTLCEFLTPETPAYSGLIVTGSAGTGKTHFIRRVESFAQNIGLKVVKTAFTHAACVQMGADAMTLNALLGINEKADPRSMLVFDRRMAARLRSMQWDLVILDEISMIPLALLEVLYLYHMSAPRTRFCFVGDFHQLNPVENVWKRDNDWDYFHHTDIYPAMVYDRMNNEQGMWLQLTECRRTEDPLLVRIVNNPLCVQDIDIREFPAPPASIPMWRFIAHRNATRKAVNLYCMHRYRWAHPELEAVDMKLVDVWVEHELFIAKHRSKRNRHADPAGGGGTATPEQEDAEADRVLREQLVRKFTTPNNQTGTGERGLFRPTHWYQLQDFVYMENMEVVCRNTLKNWTKDQAGPARNHLPDEPSECVNNRRGRIIHLDRANYMVTIRWMDTLIREDIRHREAGDAEEVVQPNRRAEDVRLSFFDFAFNFVPGFCITAHMAQGETIREHYGIMGWESEMRQNPRMAYVAVTRGTSSKLLHILPRYAEPWNSPGTNSLAENILRRLYHAMDNTKAGDNTTWSDALTFDHCMHLCQTQNKCTRCATPLIFERFNHTDRTQFAFLPPKRGMPLTNSSVELVCDNCFRAQQYEKTAPN